MICPLRNCHCEVIWCARLLYSEPTLLRGGWQLQLAVATALCMAEGNEMCLRELVTGYGEGLIMLGNTAIVTTMAIPLNHQRDDVEKIDVWMDFQHLENTSW